MEEEIQEPGTLGIGEEPGKALNVCVSRILPHPRMTQSSTLPVGKGTLSLAQRFVFSMRWASSNPFIIFEGLLMSLTFSEEEGQKPQLGPECLCKAPL